MSHRRLILLRLILLMALAFLLLPLTRWQWFRRLDLAAAAGRQRLAVQTVYGWPRADFYDREGRSLTGRQSAATAMAARDKAQLRYGPSPLAVHLIGYVNPGDGRGASGLELVCEDLLSQGDGLAISAVVDGKRRPIAGLGQRLAQSPTAAVQAVQLSMDRALQAEIDAIADRSLQKGAIVVISPWTGEVLAMSSRPAFDPRDPAGALGDSGSPFLNRALAAYSPGSIFKLVDLAATLEDQPRAFWTLYEDPGYADVGSLHFRCPGGGHGQLTLADALAFSCNTAFINLTLDLGAKKLLTMAERLGLGSNASAELPGEAPGELPAAGGMSRGDLANAAIGQKGILTTPVQIARLVAAIANGGYLLRERVLLARIDGLGRSYPLGREEAPMRVLSARTAELMRKLMGGVVRYGTGKAAALPAGVGGKTGTAQTGKVDGNGQSICHAWFAGFAPLEKPQYVAVVFVEEGDSGGRVAAPIFKEVMKAALALKTVKR